MGQKTHPTGFRTGVNKAHKASWFANYGAYSDVLKEDYKIRHFLEKKWSFQTKKEPKFFYKEAGIFKVEIQRKVNQLELIIHAIEPNVIINGLDQTNFLFTLKDNLKILVTNTKQIRIKILKLKMGNHESLLVARSIADQLEKRIPFRKALRETTKILKNSSVKGFKIQIAGRLNGSEIARAEWTRRGRVPLQSLRADISYAAFCANTIYGVIGIKVWIFSKEISKFK